MEESGVSNSQFSTSVVAKRGQVWGVGMEESGVSNSQVSTLGSQKRAGVGSWNGGEWG